MVLIGASHRLNGVCRMFYTLLAILKDYKNVNVVDKLKANDDEIK